MELRFLAGRQKYHPAYEFPGGMRQRVEPVDLVDADVVLAGVVPDLNAIVALFDETAPTRTSANIVETSHRATSDHEKRRTRRALFQGPKWKNPALAGLWDGGRTRARTWDPLIKSQLLYQLSYAPERR